MVHALKRLFFAFIGLGIAACAAEPENATSARFEVDQPQPCLNENVQLCLNDAMRKNRLRTELTPAQEKQLLQQQMTLIEKMIGGEVPVAKAAEPQRPAVEPTESEKLNDAISTLPPALTTPSAQQTLELPQVPDQPAVPEMPR